MAKIPSTVPRRDLLLPAGARRSASSLIRRELSRERAALCIRTVRLLRQVMAGMDWTDMRFADRSRLDRALARLQSDLVLARTATRTEREIIPAGTA